MNELSNKIKHFRKAKHYTQAQLAEKMFVSRKTISSWETGRSFPDFRALIRLSKIFDIPVDTLLKGDEEVLTHFENQTKQAKRSAKIARICYYLNYLFLLLSYVHMFKLFGLHSPFIIALLIINIVIFFSNYPNWQSFKRRRIALLAIGFIIILFINVFTMAFNFSFQKALDPRDVVETLGAAAGEFMLILFISISVTLAIFFKPAQNKTKQPQLKKNSK